MAEDLTKALVDEGWHLKSTAIEKTILSLKRTKNDQPSIRDIVNAAINIDFSEIGEKYIQEKLNSSKDGLLVGPCVLQVGKVRNISAPKENEESSLAPRMLKLTLTDGNSAIGAIEIERIDQISMQTSPGTKVKLIGSIPFASGVLQLQASCLRVLGGKVEKLYTKWQVAKETARFSRSGIIGDGGPPPFIAFGQKAWDGHKTNDPAGKKSLKDTKKEESENAEFSEQRKAAIAEVAKATGGGKKFSADAKPSLGKKAFQPPDRHVDTRQSAPESKPEPHQAVGMYRELSTASGENVHEKTVGEFVEMGFKRDDVILCLRRTNNDFEATMDMLVEMSNGKERVYEPRDTRGRDGRGGRRGSRRGTGRGRGRDRDQSEMEENAHASAATLFDFLESKMSSVSVSQKSMDRDIYEQYYDYGGAQSMQIRPHTYEGSNNSRRGGHRDRDDFSDRGSYRGRNDRGRGRRDYGGRGGGGEYRGRGRGGGRAGAKFSDKYHRDNADGQNYGRSNNFRSEHSYNNTENTQSRGKRYSKEHQKRFTSNNRGDMGNQEDHEPRGRGYSDGNNQDWRNNDSRRDSQRTDSRQRGQNEARGSYKHYGKRDNLKPDYSGGRNNQDDRPPRFSRQGRGRQSDHKLPGGRENQNQRASTNPRPRPASTREPFTYKDGTTGNSDSVIADQLPESIPPFPDFSENPRPAQGPATTFGSPPDLVHGTGGKPPPGRQPPRSLPQFQHQANVRVAVTLPQWQKGAHCLARYWEDSNFYEAVVADLHPTADTAVVQFKFFDNYEEVKLYDMKPLPSGTVTSQQEFAGTQGNTSFGGNARYYPPQNGQGAARMQNFNRPYKPPKALYVPPAQRATK